MFLQKYNQRECQQTMHNIRKIKKKKKTTMINSEQSAQQKLIEISRFQNEEEILSQVDLFIEKLQPKHINPEVRLPPRGRIFEEQSKLTQFINQFERKSKVNPNHISFKEMRSSSYSYAEKKPIALINYLLIDKRDKPTQKAHNTENRSKFQSLVNLKRKFSPRNKYKSQEEQADKSLDHVKLNVLSRKQEMARLLRQNAEGTAMKMKNMKFFTKYNSVFVGK